MHYSKEEKGMWLDDWRQSGKSACAYAKMNSLNPQTFIKWTKAETEKRPCLVEVPVPVIHQTLSMPEILIEKGDMRIHIPLEPVLNELYGVIAKLGQAL